MLFPLATVVLLHAMQTVIAEHLFRHMEAQLVAAKTIECRFEATFQARPGSKSEGSLLVAEGNKSRLEMADDRGEVVAFIDIVSDGKKITTGAGVTGRPRDVLKWQNEAIQASFARAGVLVPLFARPGPYKDTKDFKVADALLATDFRLGARTKLGAQEAQVVQYKLVVHGLERAEDKQRRLEVTLWLDVQTGLPLKRVVVAKEDDMEYKMTETYMKLTLGGKIDPKKFELPKE